MGANILTETKDRVLRIEIARLDTVFTIVSNVERLVLP